MRVERNILDDTYTPIVNRDYCSQCGFCVTACEFDAVLMGDWKRSSFDEHSKKLMGKSIAVAEGERPVIIAFICERSFNQEGFISKSGDRIEGNNSVAVMTIPCIGMMSPSILEDALSAGAKGALVIGCRGLDCHYREKRRRLNFSTESKSYDRFLIDNVENPRIKIMETSPFETEKLSEDINLFIEHIKTIN